MAWPPLAQLTSAGFRLLPALGRIHHALVVEDCHVIRKVDECLAYWALMVGDRRKRPIHLIVINNHTCDRGGRRLFERPFLHAVDRRVLQDRLRGMRDVLGDLNFSDSSFSVERYMEHDPSLYSRSCSHSRISGCFNVLRTNSLPKAWPCQPEKQS